MQLTRLNGPTNLGRRRTLKLIGGMATVALAGCATRPESPVVTSCPPTGLTPLAPTIIQRSPNKPLLCLDAHTHLFNAADIDVAGFLRQPIGHTLPAPQRDLLEAAIPFLEALRALFAPSVAEEMLTLCGLVARPRTLEVANPSQAIRGELEQQRAAHQQRLSESLAQLIPGTPFERLYLEQLRFYLGARLTVPNLERTVPEAYLDANEIAKALRAGSVPQPLDVQLMDFERPAEAFNPQSIFAFLGCMLSPRHHNLMQFQQSYSSDPNAFGVDACIVAMVDFDYWLGKPSFHSSIRDQVLLHEQLAALSGGYVMPVVPYNPWTDVKDANGNESLKTVEWAVRDHGCIAAKIYPPMGFFPYGNAGHSIPTTLPRPDPAELDKKLKAFYLKCLELDIVVMAHTSESNGRDRFHDALAGPLGWEAVFHEPGLAGLRTNAGHFGGEAVPTSDPHQHWTQDFATLMRDPAATRLYADLGYWDELRNPSSAAQTRLREALNNGPPIVKSRLMYGSDWEMLTNQEFWADYPRDVATVIQQTSSQPALVPSIFYANAVDCFGLAKAGPGNGANRARLEAFYSAWKLPAPAWMVALDQ